MSSGRKTGDAQRKKEKGLIKPGIGTPVIDNDVKLIDPDTGEEVPAGVPGEYCYKGRQVATYLPPIPETGYTEDGYLRSGDVMIMDEDGFMDIVDRTKDMVNVAGFKVYTETLDNVLAEHPAVEMSGSIAVADPDRPGAEQVKTFVQMREGYKPSKKLEEELTDLVAKKCLPYYKPKYYEFLEELPLTRADKIDKLYLREREKKKVRGEKVEELKTIKY
jgi:long-chain acyl-CoA synthetase